MNFTYPAFLFALVAIAIPIVIHLFNFRKFKTVYFSNVRFLKEVKQETQSRSRLRQLLILTCRILAVTFLVLAFAQPFIAAQRKKNLPGQKAISIFIDNSFSMDAINKNGTLLDEAKKKAIEIIASYKPSDRFQLLTNDFEGKHQRLVTKEEFNTLLDEVKISPVTRKITDIVSRQQDLLSESGGKTKVAYLISDFQKSMTNIGELKKDTLIDLNFVPLKAALKNNIYIDTCWFATPVRQLNQIEKLHVRIKNNSENPVENNSIKLFINGIQRTLASFSMAAHAETEVLLSYPNKESGFQQCRVVLNDYPVTFDDAFYFSYVVSKNLAVLCINHSEPGVTSSPYLGNLLGMDSLFLTTNSEENKLEYATFSSYNLIILNELKTVSSGLGQELKRFLNNGGSVLVFPSGSANQEAYQSFLTSLGANYYEHLDTANTKVEKINLDHVIYKDVFEKKPTNYSNLDLPKVFNHYVFSRLTHSREEYLLQLQNGDNFLSAFKVGNGNLYLCAVSLQTDFSNFAKHALFVPTIYMIALNSEMQHPLFYTLGKDESMETAQLITGENVYHVRKEASEFDIIPEHKIIDTKAQINIHNQLREGGNYDLYAGKEKIMPLSFNFDRLESDLNCFTPEELQTLIDSRQSNNIHLLYNGEKNLTSIIDTSEGKKLWKWCILLSLLFLGIETLLLRLMRSR